MEIVGGFFIAGLLLWWIIKSDLKEMAFQKRMTEENAKRDALAGTSVMRLRESKTKIHSLLRSLRDSIVQET